MRGRDVPTAWRVRALGFCAALALAVPASSLAASHKEISLAGVPHFSALAAAKKSCGADPVAWANLHTRVYHVAGSHWFGKTKHGAYFCKSALEKKGVKQSKE